MTSYFAIRSHEVLIDKVDSKNPFLVRDLLQRVQLGHVCSVPFENTNSYSNLVIISPSLLHRCESLSLHSALRPALLSVNEVTFLWVGRGLRAKALFMKMVRSMSTGTSLALWGAGKRAPPELVMCLN